MKAWFALVLAACSAPSSESPDAATGDTDAALDAQIDAQPPAGEMRGIWVTRFAWSTQAQLEAIIDRAAAAHFNAVFLQVRGEGDAYYRSAHEPWSRRLAGALGRDPGWDPLQVAIDRAHAHGMELHAYVNVFSAWPTSLALPAAEGPTQHPLYAHPDWLAVTSAHVNADSEYRWFSAGNPAVRAHNVAVVTDLLASYAVDGLHLDRIRQPGSDYSHDAVTEAAYTAAKAQDPALTWSRFMRAQVDAMVADIHAAVVATRPAAKLSAAVWGIYEPLPGCSTSQGLRDYHQDSLAWLDREIMDALAPMMYWSIEPGACTDWATLARGFIAERGTRQIWAGMHALDDGAFDFAQIRARVDLARTDGAQGVMVYASTYLDEDPARWSAFVGTEEAPSVFFETSPPPYMPWK
ncbi:MAG: glycoside hydrolase family 10 protein [Kofleriaceae bacterium]